MCLNVLMESRARLGVPVTMEVPDEHYEIMKNVMTSISRVSKTSMNDELNVLETC